MMPTLSDADRELLFALQRGLPIEPRPFRAMARELGMAEDRVVTRAARFVDTGLLRRFGAVFDARRLGYRSTLCAVDLPGEDVAAVAKELVLHAGMTHCYRRGWPVALDPAREGAPAGVPMPALWFTLSAPAERFERDLRALADIAGPDRFLVLPAVRRFKIDVVFDPRSRDGRDHAPAAPADVPDLDVPVTRLDESDKRVVRVMQGNLPVTPEPFAYIASRAGVDGAMLLERLAGWRRTGVLRRVAFIARHRRLGFQGNAMCVWNVEAKQVVAKGRLLAQAPWITHCYQRSPDPRFPFNLYAMLHARTWDETHARFVELARSAGLPGGRLLCSLREFKKSSMRYFEADESAVPARKPPAGGPPQTGFR